VAITASTRLCASLGHWPANRQTTSPIMHNTAFEELGLDYRRFVVQPADVGVRVFSRSEAKGRALADGLGASNGGQCGHVAAAAPGILVNATSIGNDLRSDVPVPDAVFATARIVMDVVTRPGRSALLVRAAAAGARTIGGGRMLVLQGAFAFEQLTGHQAPVATMQQAVERALGA
jgi:shikimate dehydrogenase